MTWLISDAEQEEYHSKCSLIIYRTIHRCGDELMQSCKTTTYVVVEIIYGCDDWNFASSCHGSET